MTDRQKPRDPRVDFQTLVDRSQQGIVLLDANGIIFANSILYDICGYSIEELEAMTIDDVIGLVHPDDRDLVAARMANRFAGDREPDRYTFRFIHKSGAVKWMELQTVLFDHDGEYLIQAHMLEVTKYVETARALKHSESRLGAAIESLPFDFYALDLSGRYVLQNTICREHGGDVIGLTPSEVDVDDETKAIWENNNRRAFAGETIAEEQRIRTGGQDRTCYAIVTPVFDGKEIIGIQGVNIDISDLRRAQEKTAEMETQLRHSQKMEAVGTLAGGIAHDFNNLLMCIIGNVELLKRRIQKGKTPMDPSNLETIESAADRAASLTRQLLNFSRKDAVKYTTFNVADLINESISLIENSFKSDIVIESQVSAHDIYVRGDIGQLQQVLINLAVNARDAMPDGGTLRFKIEEGKDPERPLEIAISDTGCGIPDDYHQRIFEPFFTTKETGKGTGMGLAVAYSIVESHGGVIELKSEEGVGTRFTIRLPIEDPGGEVREESKKRTGEATQPRTILVVDDEPGVQSVVSEQLAMLGHQSIVASNGLEALDRYREDGRQIDLTLLDIAMPVMNGTECQKEIRRIDPGAKIVMMTGQLSKEMNQQLSDQGTSVILRKPFVMQDLQDALNEAFSRPVETEPVR